MLDQSKKGYESEEMRSKSSSGDELQASNNSIEKKTCADCGTTKTPLWRGGPAGPKSLCNACGIRSRKKRRAILNGGSEEKKPKKVNKNPLNRSGGSKKLGDSLKQRLYALGRSIDAEINSGEATKEAR